MENSLRDFENPEIFGKFFYQFLAQITQLHIKQPQKIDTCSYLKNISIFSFLGIVIFYFGPNTGILKNRS